jgi:hypothetical protein
VLLNTAGSVNPGELAANIADVVLGKVPEPTATYSGDLSAFEGTYEGVGRGRRTSVTISVDNRALIMKGAAPAPQLLTYRSGDTFGVAQTLVTFEREAGRVMRLRLDTVGGHYPLRRKATASE